MLFNVTSTSAPAAAHLDYIIVPRRRILSRNLMIILCIFLLESTRGLPEKEYLHKRNSLNLDGNFRRRLRIRGDSILSKKHATLFTLKSPKSTRTQNQPTHFKVWRILTSTTLNALTEISKVKTQLTLAPTTSLLPTSSTSMEPTPFPVSVSINVPVNKPRPTKMETVFVNKHPTLTPKTETIPSTASPISSTVITGKPRKTEQSSLMPTKNTTKLFKKSPISSPSSLEKIYIAQHPTSMPSKKRMKLPPSSPPFSANPAKPAVLRPAPLAPTKIIMESLTASPTTSTAPITIKKVTTSERPTPTPIKTKITGLPKSLAVPVLLPKTAVSKRPKLLPTKVKIMEAHPASPLFPIATLSIGVTAPISQYEVAKPQSSSSPKTTPMQGLPTAIRHPNHLRPSKKEQPIEVPTPQISYPLAVPLSVSSPTSASIPKPRRQPRPSVKIHKSPAGNDLNARPSVVQLSSSPVTVSVITLGTPHQSPAMMSTTSRSSSPSHSVTVNPSASTALLNNLLSGESIDGTAGNSRGSSSRQAKNWIFPVLSIGGFILLGVMGFAHYKASQRSVAAGRDRAMGYEEKITENNKDGNKGTLEQEEHNAYPKRTEKHLEKSENDPRSRNEESFEMHVNAIHSEDLSTLYDTASQKADESYFNSSISTEKEVDCDYGSLLKSLFSAITAQS